MEEVADRCNGKVSCSVAASNGIFGDPCYGTYKYLEVQYTCEQPAQTSIACEGSELDISCEAGTVINLISANYGRLAEGKDVCPHTHTSDTNCKSTTSMEEVADRCNGKVSCSVAASNGIFGDPCYGTYKYLEVQYTCEPTAQCPDGFIGPPGSNQCFKVYTSFGLNWDAVKAQCISDGLVLAHPSDEAVPWIRAYIRETHGYNHVWLDARGNGTHTVWQRTGEAIPKSSPMWISGEPSDVSTGGCLLMLGYPAKPDQSKPYRTWDCSLIAYWALCEQRKAN